MTDTEPTFRVKTEQGRKILLPQFQPSDLDDEEREVYDGLRKAAPRHHAGAIAVNELAATQFEPGETVTLEETARRYMSGAREFVEAFRAFRASVGEVVASALEELAKACQPLVECQQDVAEDIAENFDDE